AAVALPAATVLALPGAAERNRPSVVRSSAHAVVRVRAGGSTEVISSCADDRCSVRDDAAPGLVDLVLLDLQPWYRAGGKADDAAVARAMSLVESVARQPSHSLRVLALSVPVEGGFELGLGSNLDPIATFHLLPPALQQALIDGVFDGVIAGSERALHLQRDLSPAIARTDKVYLRRPLWQLVSGNAADPSAGRLARRLRWVHGVGLQPEYASFAPGFAVLHLHDGPPRATLVAWRRRRWVTATIALPRAGAAPGPRVLPGMTPCLRCTAVPSTDKP
ncbi:MAG: hypothetical protein K1X88_31470, partial [Nannocystaceae bacterium]|nr:hypothetical protein [Nannocystaceae bacterium]